MIESKQIIAIFDVQLLKNSHRLQQIVKKNMSSGCIYGNKEDAKSIIITDEAVYYSPLSTLTLKNRDELYQTMG